MTAALQIAPHDVGDEMSDDDQTVFATVPFATAGLLCLESKTVIPEAKPAAFA